MPPYFTRNGRSTGEASQVTRKSRRRRQIQLQVTTLEDRLLLSIVPSEPAIHPFDNDNGGVQSLGSHRTIAEASDGNFGVVWDDTNGGGIDYEVFTGSTHALSLPTHVGSTTSADSQETVSCDADGDAVVAWTHKNTDGSTQVEAEMFGPTGVGGTIGVVSPSGSWSLPTVGVTSASSFLVAFENNSGASPVVQVTQVSPFTNQLLTSPGLTVTNAAEPSLAVNSLGVGVLAYTDSAHALHTQRLSATSGVAVGASVVLASFPNNVVSQPSAGIDAQGDVAVAFTYVVKQTVVSNPPFGSFTVYQTDVHVALMNSGGSIEPSIVVTNSTSNTDSGYSPSLGMDPAGNFVVACEVGDSYGHPEGYDQNVLAAKAYSSTGAFLQSLYLPAPNPKSEDFLPSIAINTSGQLVADFVDETPGVGGELPPPIKSILVQPFIGAPFQFSLLGNRTINLNTGVPSSLELLDITPDPGFTASQISLAFQTLPPGISASVNQIQTPGRSDFRFEVTLTAATSITTFESFATSFDLVSAGYLTVISPIFQVNVGPSALTSISLGVFNGWQGNGLLPGFPALIGGSGFIPGSTVDFVTTGGVVAVTPTSIASNEIIVPVPEHVQTGSVVTVVRPAVPTWFPAPSRSAAPSSRG